VTAAQAAHSARSGLVADRGPWGLALVAGPLPARASWPPDLGD